MYLLIETCKKDPPPPPPLRDGGALMGGTWCRRLGNARRRVGGSVYISARAHMDTCNFGTVTGCFFECVCPPVQNFSKLAQFFPIFYVFLQN